MVKASALDLDARPVATGVAAQPHARVVPRVSVIVPHFNDLDNLRICLALLRGQVFPAADAEIIVADNNSSCGIEAVRAACPEGVTLIHVREKGAAHARNAAVAAARGGVLAFIDSDCKPAHDWLANGLAALSSADMAGGRVDVSVSEAITGVEAFEKVFAFNIKRYIETENFGGSGNLFVSRAVFDAVGGFRAGVSEDKDWGQRAVAKGFRWVYADDAAATHPARRTWAELCAKWARVTRETYGIAKEKPFGRLRFLIRTFAILPSPFVHTLVILRSRKLLRLRDKLSAIAILFRIRAWRFIESLRVLISDLSSR